MAFNVETIEMRGRVKWFDNSKGYGFIHDDSGEDVLLHVSVLRAAGQQRIFEGAVVHGKAIRRSQGLQATEIDGVDESGAIFPFHGPQRTHVSVTPESGWEMAMVKWFNRVRGFGFLTRGVGTPDIFVHMETLRQYGFTELRPGQIVQVKWGSAPKGPMAAELKPA